MRNNVKRRTFRPAGGRWSDASCEWPSAGATKRVAPIDDEGKASAAREPSHESLSASVESAGVVTGGDTCWMGVMHPSGGEAEHGTSGLMPSVQLAGSVRPLQPFGCWCSERSSVGWMV